MPDALSPNVCSAARARLTLAVVLTSIACLGLLAGIPLSSEFSQTRPKQSPASNWVACESTWRLNGDFEMPSLEVNDLALHQQLSADLVQLVGIEETLSNQATIQLRGDLQRWDVLRQAVLRDEARLAALGPPNNPCR